MKEFIISIEKLARMVETILENELIDTDLSRGQYEYILYLLNNEGTNQYDISQDLLIDKTTVAKALKKLEQSKYIMRKVDQRDKRKVKVYLTKKGKDLNNYLNDVYKELDKKISLHIRPEVKEQFLKLIDIYLQELDLSWSKIKNYKKKVSFERATKKDYEQLENRYGLKMHSSDMLFVKKIGDYVLDWIKYHEVNEVNAIVAKEIKLHPIESKKEDEKVLIDEFEKWYSEFTNGQLFYMAEDKDVKFQQTIIENGLLFKRFETTDRKVFYYYDRFVI